MSQIVNEPSSIIKQVEETFISDKKRQTISWSLFIIVILAILAGLTFIYWENYPYASLEVKNNPLPLISSSKIHQGDQILFDANFCKNIRADDYIERSLVGDRAVITLPVEISNVPPGCQEIPTPNLLPRTLTNGTYHIHYRVSYWVNPIKVVVVEFDTMPFTVTQ